MSDIKPQHHASGNGDAANKMYIAVAEIVTIWTGVVADTSSVSAKTNTELYNKVANLRTGLSELSGHVPLTNAINKSITDALNTSVIAFEKLDITNGVTHGMQIASEPGQTQVEVIEDETTIRYVFTIVVPHKT